MKQQPDDMLRAQKVASVACAGILELLGANTHAGVCAHQQRREVSLGEDSVASLHSRGCRYAGESPSPVGWCGRAWKTFEERTHAADPRSCSWQSQLKHSRNAAVVAEMDVNVPRCSIHIRRFHPEYAE
eukprot:3234543-Prymnesium_polylepis.4